MKPPYIPPIPYGELDLQHFEENLVKAKGVKESMVNEDEMKKIENKKEDFDRFNFSPTISPTNKNQ